MNGKTHSRKVLFVKPDTRLFSMNEIARRFGVSKRSIQRAAKSGALQWHGRARRGRYATGISMADAAAWAGGAHCTAPKWAKAKRNLGDAWRPVMQTLIRAAAGGADLDLLHAAIETVVSDSTALMTFKRAVQGHPCKRDFGYKLGAAVSRYADGPLSRKGRECLSQLTFQEAWFSLRKQAFSAPVDINFEPIAVMDETGKVQSLELHFVPAWLGGGGVWPDFARESVITSGALSHNFKGLRKSLRQLADSIRSTEQLEHAKGVVMTAVGGLGSSKLKALCEIHKLPFVPVATIAAATRLLRRRVSGGQGGASAGGGLVNASTVARVFGVSHQAIARPRVARLGYFIERRHRG